MQEVSTQLMLLSQQRQHPHALHRVAGALLQHRPAWWSPLGAWWPWPHCCTGAQACSPVHTAHVRNRIYDQTNKQQGLQSTIPIKQAAVTPWQALTLSTNALCRAVLCDAMCCPYRCSDKSAVVRGRALADLAEVVDCFAALLAQDPASEQHQVAEVFVEGLGAAAALQVSWRHHLVGIH